MTHAHRPCVGFRDPLRQAILGDSPAAPEPLSWTLVALWSVALFGPAFLVLAHRDGMALVHYYIELLISLCT